MAREIRKQANGKYAIWSSVVDDYIVMGATPEEIVEMYVGESRDSIIESVKRQVARADQREIAECVVSTFTKL